VRLTFAVFLAVLTAALALSAACGGGGDGEVVVHTLPPVSSTAPSIDAELKTLSDGLQFATIAEGGGATPRVGDQVTVNYSGWLKDGELFDSSLKEGRTPFQFILGQGGVIKGWDEGVKLMKVGGLYRLVIPPELAYGDQANGSIPANSTLVFDISVVSAGTPSITPSPTPVPTVDSTPPPIDAQPTTLPDGVQFLTITEGQGNQVQPHDHVSVEFQGWVLGGGQFADSTTPGSPALDFIVGEQQVIPGFDEGVQLMRVGGQYRLIIPPELAFGSAGTGPVPANSTVIFDVTVVSSEPAATAAPTP
jgi:peptidylprolyl isomerase